MMIRASFAALLLTASSTLVASPAHAEDPRLVEKMYDQNEIVRINGRVNVQSTIRFGAEESIENVAIGDSQQWQVTPNRRANLLFVKPLAPRAVTNMTVVTNKRTYLFDLVADTAARSPLYVLTFLYPEEPETEEERQARLAESGAIQPVRPNATEMAAASDPYAVVDPAQLNHRWKSTGSAALLPVSVYDDGTATFITFPADAPVPAILVKNKDGALGPVNFAVRGDITVLDIVPREIVLRSGEETATLRNEGPVSAALPDGSARKGA